MRGICCAILRLCPIGCPLMPCPQAPGTRPQQSVGPGGTDDAASCGQLASERAGTQQTLQPAESPQGKNPRTSSPLRRNNRALRSLRGRLGGGVRSDTGDLGAGYLSPAASRGGGAAPFRPGEAADRLCMPRRFWGTGPIKFASKAATAPCRRGRHPEQAARCSRSDASIVWTPPAMSSVPVVSPS
jgi:hypothetical protein